MFSRFRRFLRYAMGDRSIAVESESAKRLALCAWPNRVIFDKVAGHVTRNGAVVAAMTAIDRIEIHKPPSQEGTMNWYLTIHVNSGAKPIQVGQVTDQTDASIIGAKIASLTGRPVSARP